MTTAICVIVALVIGILIGRNSTKPDDRVGYNDPRLKLKPHIPPVPPLRRMREGKREPVNQVEIEAWYRRNKIEGDK